MRIYGRSVTLSLSLFHSVSRSSFPPPLLFLSSVALWRDKDALIAFAYRGSWVVTLGHVTCGQTWKTHPALELFQLCICIPASRLYCRFVYPARLTGRKFEETAPRPHGLGKQVSSRKATIPPSSIRTQFVKLHQNSSPFASSLAAFPLLVTNF